MTKAGKPARFVRPGGTRLPWTGNSRVRPIFRRGVLVAAVCDVCGKGPGFGMSVSHSHRRTRRRWNPNIQTVHALVGRTRKRLNVCTSCIKAGKVQRAG